jgi:uncharacterized membrane protein YphA (DoxX/SURF4 family)
MNTLFIYSFLIVLMFLLSGYSKIKDIGGTANFLQNNVQLNMPFKMPFEMPFVMPFNIYIVAILIVIFLQIIGSLTILYSSATSNAKQYAYYSSISLAGFTVLATLIFHLPMVGENYYTVMRNISITGALLLLSDKFK